MPSKSIKKKLIKSNIDPKEVVKRAKNKPVNNINEITFDEKIKNTKDEEIVKSDIGNTNTKKANNIKEIEIKKEKNRVISKHDKYRKYLDMVNSGYIRDISYEEAMDMLRWCEKRVGRTIPFTFSCGSCLYDLVQLFSRLEKK